MKSAGAHGVYRAGVMAQLINATARYSKMRKSLGSKRQFIDDPNIDAIVRLYGAFEEGEESKIFPTEAYGYRRSTVKRPLRLNFQASEERMRRILDEKPIEKLDDATPAMILAACEALDRTQVYRDREALTRDLKQAREARDLKLGAPQIKAVSGVLDIAHLAISLLTVFRWAPDQAWMMIRATGMNASPVPVRMR